MKPLRPLLFLVLAACADGLSPEDSSKIAVPERPHPEVEAPYPPPPPPPAYEEVSGTLVTDLGEPIVSRAVSVVDARGKRFDTETVEDGVFRIADVATPYDLAIAQAPKGDVIVPTVFLGLSRTDPTIELFERDGPVGYPPSQVLSLAVMPPRCIAKGCTVSVISRSPHGSACESIAYSGTPSPIHVLLVHAWFAPFVPGGETIDVHVLTSDADRTAFAYAHVAEIPIAPGETGDLGTLAPSPVAVVGPLAIAPSQGDLPSTWKRTLQTYIDFPGGATIPLFTGPGVSLVSMLPSIPGATVRAVTWGLEPMSSASPSTYGASQAWSGARSIASTAIDLETPRPPSPVRPERDGAMSRHGTGIAWSAATPALTTVTLVDVARRSMRLRVVTDGDEIPTARLVALGLRRFEPGPHMLDLVTSPGETLDVATSPDADVRRRRFDPQLAGSATYQRLSFMVTP